MKQKRTYNSVAGKQKPDHAFTLIRYKNLIIFPTQLNLSQFQNSHFLLTILRFVQQLNYQVPLLSQYNIGGVLFQCL
jgi:hypothetical protein